jgi:hypothetical protein
MNQAQIDTITVNGVTYYSERPSPVPNGKRAVVVVDRGWIFAGDVTKENGRIYLDRAVWVFNWQSIGFDGVLKNPKSDKVNIKKLDNRVDIPEGAEVFSIPVVDSWGL